MSRTYEEIKDVDRKKAPQQPSPQQKEEASNVLFDAHGKALGIELPPSRWVNPQSRRYWIVITFMAVIIGSLLLFNIQFSITTREAEEERRAMVKRINAIEGGSSGRTDAWSKSVGSLEDTQQEIQKLSQKVQELRLRIVELERRQESQDFVIAHINKVKDDLLARFTDLEIKSGGH